MNRSEEFAHVILIEDIDRLDRMLRSGYSCMEKIGDNKTALMLAAEGSAPSLKRFLQDKPNLSRPSDMTMSPMRFALRVRNTESIRLLLDAGADPYDGTSFAAAENDLTYAVKVVGGDIKAMFEQAAKKFELIDLAASGKTDKMLERLKQERFDLSITGHQGNAVLMQTLLLCRWDHEEFPMRPTPASTGQVVLALLSAGADANQPNKQGQTPLFEALCYADEAIIEQLIASGAKVNVKNAAGENPLACALRYGRHELLPILHKQFDLEIAGIIEGASSLQTKPALIKPIKVIKKNGGG